MSLTSKIGQLSKFNKGQDRYVKDRVELGLPSKLAPFKLNDRLLWYGFKVKSPNGKFIPNAHSVTFQSSTNKSKKMLDVKKTVFRVCFGG